MSILVCTVVLQLVLVVGFIVQSQVAEGTLFELYNFSIMLSSYLWISTRELDSFEQEAFMEKRHGKSDSQSMGAQFQHKVCVLHYEMGLTPYAGRDAAKVIESKRTFAQRHNFKFIHMQQSPAQRLFDSTCALWSVFRQGAFHSHFHIQIKFCTVLEILQEGQCEWLMWTDADAIFSNMDFPLPAAVGVSRGYKGGRHDAVDVIWSTTSTSTDCQDPHFYSGLNTGLFFIRNSQASRLLIQHILSFKDASFSTADSGFEQCNRAWHGDQCAVLGASNAHPAHFSHYHCTPRPTGKPSLMKVVTAQHCQTGMSAREAADLKTSLLLNCAGKNAPDCVSCLVRTIS